MFRSDSYFAQRNIQTGAMDWFFHSREGVQGPYPSKSAAMETREAYSAFCRKRGLDGGRKSGFRPPETDPWQAADTQPG